MTPAACCGPQNTQDVLLHARDLLRVAALPSHRGGDPAAAAVVVAAAGDERTMNRQAPAMRRPSPATRNHIRRSVAVTFSGGGMLLFSAPPYPHTMVPARDQWNLS